MTTVTTEFALRTDANEAIGSVDTSAAVQAGIGSAGINHIVAASSGESELTGTKGFSVFHRADAIRSADIGIARISRLSFSQEDEGKRQEEKKKREEAFHC
jgi:hypothetical protein